MDVQPPQETRMVLYDKPPRGPAASGTKKALLGVGVFLVVCIAGYLMLSLLFPQELSLITSAIISNLNNPKSNQTFVASGVKFVYPATWVPVNVSIFASVVYNQTNSSQNNRFQNKTQIGIIAPASEILSLVADGPGLLSRYLSNPKSFRPPSNLTFIIAGAATILNRSFNPRLTIVETVSNASIKNITLGGYNGVHVNIANETVINITATYAELSVAESHGSVCFVFGFTGERGEISDLNQSFYRVSQSLQCSFSQIGTSVPVPILDRFLSLLS